MPPSSKRSYAHKTRCPIAHALDIVGDKWTLLVIRDVLLFDKHEFGEFQQSEEAIASNILSDRLARLTELEIFIVRPHPKSKLKKRYFLSEKGIALSPILAELANWSAEYNPNVPAEVAQGMKQADMGALHQQFRQRAENWLTAIAAGEA